MTDELERHEAAKKALEDSPKGYPQTSPYDWWVWHDTGETEPDRD